MPEINPFRMVELRASSAAAMTASTTLTNDDLTTMAERYRGAKVHIVTTDQNLPNGANQIDFFLQTTYDDGANWVDIEDVRYLDASADTGFNNNETSSYIMVVSEAMASSGRRNVTDGTLAANTKLDLGLGNSLRLKVIFLNQTGSPSITFSVNVLLHN